jgi:outer membrane receptor for ferrienterochelin and colicin
MQDFETYDGNVRVTWRPHQKVSLVGRYEYQLSTIHSTPDTLSGLGEVEASEMTSHIFALNANWTPWSRLYLQAGVNYVISETDTPTSEYTEAILDAQNNYWTVNLNSGFVVDDKTDLNLGVFYFSADNYDNNSAYGLPLGLSAEEYGITATLTRRLTERLRLTLRYAYFDYNEDTFGGHESFASHWVYSGLQYRF